MIINQVVSGGSTPAPSGKYQLLQRVSDDSNNEIGTVCGFHTDANSVEYAIVCLDAMYRMINLRYLSSSVEVTGLASLTDQTFWGSADTATSNCTKILDFATANGYTSTAVSHCRNQSFVIDGTTYYGQLPTIAEVVMIFTNRTAINTKDTSGHITLLVPDNTACWSSTQKSTTAWFIGNNGYIGLETKSSQHMVLPILELPNA